MKRLRYRLAILAILIPLCNGFASAVTLKLAYADVESYPFQIGNGSQVSELPGLSLDIINTALTPLDVDIDYVRVPGRRVLQYIKSGRVDGGFIFSYNKERAQYAVYPMKDGQPDSSKRIATLGYYFYKLKDQAFDWDGSSLSTIKDKIVGAHSGYSITTKLKESNINVYEVKNTEQLFNMLRTRHIDIIAIQEAMAQQYLKDKRWRNAIERVEPAITAKDYFLIFSNQFMQSHPNLVTHVWESVEDIRDAVISSESGKYLNYSSEQSQ